MITAFFGMRKITSTMNTGATISFCTTNKRQTVQATSSDRSRPVGVGVPRVVPVDSSFIVVFCLWWMVCDLGVDVGSSSRNERTKHTITLVDETDDTGS